MGLTAGNSLELFLPKCNKGKDWTISNEAFIDLNERSTTRIEIIFVEELNPPRKAPCLYRQRYSLELYESIIGVCL